MRETVWDTILRHTGTLAPFGSGIRTRSAGRKTSLFIIRDKSVFELRSIIDQWESVISSQESLDIWQSMPQWPLVPYEGGRWLLTSWNISAETEQERKPGPDVLEISILTCLSRADKCIERESWATQVVASALEFLRLKSTVFTSPQLSLTEANGQRLDRRLRKYFLPEFKYFSYSENSKN